jgi:hypothetical protein
MEEVALLTLRKQVIVILKIHLMQGNATSQFNKLSHGGTTAIYYKEKTSLPNSRH